MTKDKELDNNILNHLQEQNLFLMIFLTLVTLFFYIIEWFKDVNVILNKLDQTSPNKEQPFLFMFLFPISFAFLTIIVRLLGLTNYFIYIIETNIWIFILFFVIKYKYEFSVSFSRLIDINFFKIFGISLIPFLNIIILQIWINEKVKKYNITKRSNSYLAKSDIL